MVAKPVKAKGKKPISRHPLFAPMVALWFGALFGLGSLAIRPSLLESAVLAMRLDLAIPAAAPPLGFTFRILFALTLFVLGGAIGYFLVRRITRPAKSESVTPSRSFMRKDSAGAAMPMGTVAAADSDDDDFARLDSARIAQEKADNALPGRRRSLAMDESFEAEDAPFSDFAPLPGGRPQILDLAELGPISETEFVEPETEPEATPAPFAPVAASVNDAFAVADEAEPVASDSVAFDPWNRHPAQQGFRAGAEFAAAPAAPESVEAPSFAAPAAQDFRAPDPFAAPVAAAPFSAPESAAAPEAAFSARAFAAPADFSQPQATAPFAEPASFAAPAPFAAPEAAPAFAAPDIAAASEPAEVPDFAAHSFAAAEPAESAPIANTVEAVESEEATQVAPQTVADTAPSGLPVFGNVTGDAAEKLVGSPVGSLGVVQLAERLALAIARKREAAAPAAPAAPAAAPLAAFAPEPPVMAAPSPPVPVVSPVPPSFAPPPAFSATPASEAPAVADNDVAEAVEPQPEAVTAPAPGLFTTPSALPAALRPLSFDDDGDEDDDDAALTSFLPPRGFSLPNAAPVQAEEPAPRQEFVPSPPPVAAEEPVAEEPAAHEAEDDGYGSLLGMKTPARTFVRIEEPVEEMPSVEPVVIFPGQDTRQAFGQAPVNPFANPSPPVGAGEGGRLFDAPPAVNGAIRQPLANAPAIDPQETERQLKAALATLQRMSGAA